MAVETEERRIDWANWSAGMIDRLWVAAEGGRRPKLDALRLMDALQYSSDARGVLAFLDAGGHFVLASELRSRPDEIEQALVAWRKDHPGAESGGARVSKWTALARLTGLSAKNLERLWQRERSAPKSRKPRR